jgi:hypothetical protein
MSPAMTGASDRMRKIDSPQPILTHHNHCRGIEFAIAHELATDGAAGGLVAGGKAVAEMLLGPHGAGAVLDDVEVVKLGEVEAAVG